MKILKIIFSAALLLFSVVAFSQSPIGGFGVVRTAGTPTWARTAATDAQFSWDETNAKLYYNNTISSTWTEFKAFADLSSGEIFVGSAGNVSAAVTPSGAVAMTNAGVFTIAAGGINDQANGLDIDVTTSAGAISVGYDFTELTNLGATPDAADEVIIRDDTDGSYKAVTYSNLVSAASTLYTADGTITSATRTVTFTDATTTDLIFTDGTNELARLTDAGTTGTWAVTGNVTVGLDLTVTGNDITFGNGETISNATDGTVLITSPITAVSAALTVAGDATLGDAAGDAITLNSDAVTIPNIQTFASITAAETALGQFQIWACSAVNVLGQPAGDLQITLN